MGSRTRELERAPAYTCRIIPSGCEHQMLRHFAINSTTEERDTGLAAFLGTQMRLTSHRLAYPETGPFSLTGNRSVALTRALRIPGSDAE